MRTLFSSESVTEGHPDKICDQISDAVLDAIYEQDPYGRVACETITTTGMVLLFGEISTSARVDYAAVARQTLREIGYTDSAYGIDAETCAVLCSLDEQSSDIAAGVNLAHELRTGQARGASEADTLGAGDQGLMFGYAVRETPELMPLPIALAHRLAQQLAAVRKQGVLPWARPDGKSQVTVVYEDGRPVAIDTVVVSTQHDPDVSQDDIEAGVIQHVIEATIPPELLTRQTRFLVNPTGRFVRGGPYGDAGLTGRKIIVDTYGGMGRHGGGAFSGKDVTKVDRSGAYGARYVAKNIVAAGLAERCEIQVAYAIGVAHPVSIRVDTFGTGEVDEQRLAEVVRDCFDFRPGAIIERLRLRRPIYRQTAAYGHFGRPDLDLPWEATDLAAELAAAFNVRVNQEKLG